VVAQLKGGVRALRAPVHDLLSNWAYMVMTSLAWNLKAWLALWMHPRPGRWYERHRAEQEQVLRMEFRTFVASFMRIPCQIINTGRKLVHRLLAWNAWQAVLFRLASQFRKPLRCRDGRSSKPESECSGPPRHLAQRGTDPTYHPKLVTCDVPTWAGR
jgi:hypothetical protein